MSAQGNRSASPTSVIAFKGLTADERIIHLQGQFEMLDAGPAVKHVSEDNSNRRLRK